MIKFENVEVMGWEHAIRGMRNPMNSWDKSDSFYKNELGTVLGIGWEEEEWNKETYKSDLIIGEEDLNLMIKLSKAGTDHRKFMRMITVYVDITAPLYWWKEFSTYKVGTVANSCSTMHKIQDKEFTLDDFSGEHLMTVPDLDDIYGVDVPLLDVTTLKTGDDIYSPMGMLVLTVRMLNLCREKYLETKDKKYWWQMIQLLPSSYNQKRTVMLNYEVLANIYKSRRNHKLDEWSEHDEYQIWDNLQEGHGWTNMGFCDWIKTLPYSELITMNTDKVIANVKMDSEDLKKNFVTPAINIAKGDLESMDDVITILEGLGDLTLSERMRSIRNRSYMSIEKREVEE